PKPRKDLVSFLIERGRWEDAVVEGRRYLSDHPDDADFASYFGASLSVRGFLDESAEILRRAVDLRPSRYTYDRLAWVMTRRGDPRAAIEVLNAAAKRYTDSWEFPFLLGVNRARLGDRAGAIAALERATVLDPDLPDVAEVLNDLR
ncbi:MAG: tetratricopeptide repeat protein, partial [Candidatus Rokuibacteriota bacterium]